jgi:hypothetical protein
MAAASGQALIAGVNAVRVRQRPGLAAGKGEAAWAVNSFEIEAKLRAYFSPAIVNDWNKYRSLVSTALGASYHRLRVEEPVSSTRDDATYRRAVHLVNELQASVRQRRRRFESYSVGSRPVLLWGDLQWYLGKLENDTARAVLSAKPNGYSTSFSDFVHDLIP